MLSSRGEVTHLLQLLHFVIQCLQRRALHPSDQLPDLSPVVEASLQVPSSVATNSQPVLEQLKKQFKLEPVAKKESATGETVFSAELVHRIVSHFMLQK